MTRWLAPLALAVVSAVAGGLALATAGTGTSTFSSSSAAASGATEGATPVLSPRRVPQVLAATVGEVRLTNALDATLGDPSFGRAATCLTVEQGDRLVYARDPDASLLPASTMKVLTGMAALRRLGQDFRYVTEVRAASPAAGGVVDGPLWMVGAGDPLLATENYAASFRNQPQVVTRLESLADAVVAAGVREVRGGVMGDESRYDGERYVGSWKPVYLSDGDVGPVSALTVNDGFTQFRPKSPVAAPRPAMHAAEVLTFLLRVRGVVVGEPGEGRAPPSVSAVVASVSSPPLTEVVGEMLRESDNMTAELLLKEMGRRFGAGGSWAAGLAVIRDTVQEAGLPVDAYRAVDGSGLDVSDRLSCALLMDALDLAGPGGAVAAGFPVAGRTGTLADRFKGNPAEGKLRAKTGSLNFVAGLAGFVDSAGAGTLEFALLANDLPDRLDSGRRLQERIGAALSQYPQAPPIETLAPRPPPAAK